MTPLPSVTTIHLSSAIAGAIAAAQISDDDFDGDDPVVGKTVLRRLREDSVSMKNLEPVVKQLVDQIATEVKSRTGKDPGEPVVRIFDFVKGAMKSSSPTFILPLPRRKDPENAPMLPMVRFEESGQLVTVRFRAFHKADCGGYLLKSGTTMRMRENEVPISIMMVRFPPETVGEDVTGIALGMENK